MWRRFVEVDVFGEAPLSGNPVGVVVDSEGLNERDMQRFASWTNFSETTFLSPPQDPTADYAVRIFTPVAELPFAGHPTLGTCHVWLSFATTGESSKQSVVQECAAGKVEIRRTEQMLAFAAPPLRRSGPVEEELVRHLAEVLNLRLEQVVDSQWVDNGPGWVAVLLSSSEEVRELRPGIVDMSIGVLGPCPEGSAEQFEVRAFFSKSGATTEDPVTGSLNASLAQWLTATGRATTPFRVRQGAALERCGRVHVTSDEHGTIWVGGNTATRVSGLADV